MRKKRLRELLLEVEAQRIHAKQMNLMMSKEVCKLKNEINVLKIVVNDRNSRIHAYARVLRRLRLVIREEASKANLWPRF